MNCKMLVTDLDRTLLNDDGIITGKTMDILSQCRKKDIYIVFATARPYRATKINQAFVPDYVISNNGATINKGETELYKKSIPREVTDRLIDLLCENEDITAFSVEMGGGIYTSKEFPSWGTGWNNSYYDFKKGLEGVVPKLSVECRDISIVPKLIADFPMLNSFSHNEEQWVQIMHKDVSKYNGIQKVADLVKISTDEIIAFGDDLNDVEMISRCGTGVAVENAIEAVKHAADYICGANHNDGVAKWIEQHVLI